MNGRVTYAVLALLICASVRGAGDAPDVVIPQLAKSPVIDGRLSPHEWDGAGRIEGFPKTGSSEKAQPPTTAWLGVDSRNLYLAVRCTLPAGKSPSARIRQRDGELWKDHSIEFFIQPRPSQGRYYHFIVNPIGTRYDGLGPDAVWNADWKAKTARERNAWTLEVAIPLNAIGMKATGIQAIKLNVCRNGEQSQTWAPLSGGYHSPQQFGTGICTFGLTRGQRFNRDKVSWNGEQGLRKPNPEPEITGEIALDDRAWNTPGKVTKSRGVEHELASELLLKTLLRRPKPVLAFDPTDDETITCFADFKGRLYIGSCTKPAMTPTGSVAVYDPDLDVWEKVFQVNEEGLVRLEVYGDRLYIAGYDANDGEWDLGNIYVHDGSSWVEKRTVPRAIHIYGLAKYRDRVYVSADIIDAPPEGMPFQEALDKGILRAHGRVVSSGDGGETWREDYCGPTEGQDVGFLAVFEDQILLNARGDLIVFDGKKWKPLGLNPSGLYVNDYAPNGDTLLLATSLGLGYWEAGEFHLSRWVTWENLRALTRYGDNWFLVGYLVPGTVGGHGPGGTRYPEITGDKGVACISHVYIVPADRLTWRAEVEMSEDDWWSGLRRFTPDETCASAITFRGRVYFGTHGKSRVLVLPVLPHGLLDSAPHRVDNAGKLRLWWHCATPPGTSVAFQVRSAPTVEELEKTAFVGPNGSPRTSFAKQGTAFAVPQGYVQYRAILKTDNPARTPYVKRVVLTRGE